MKLAIILLLVVVSCHQSTAVNLLPFIGYKSNLPQTICTILLRHFSHPHEAVLINQAFSSSTSAQLQGDLLNEVMILTGAKLALRFYYPRKDFVRPRFFNMFIVDGYRSFQTIHATMHYAKYDFSGFYLIVIAGKVVQEVNNLIRAMLEDLWAFDIVNVNVVVGGKRDEVLIYTFFPYTENHCGKMRPMLWYNLSGGAFDLNGVNLYPDRMKNFHDCTLVGGTFEAKPYTIIPNQENSPGAIVLSGFEGDLVELLAMKLNFSVRYEISPNGSSWGFARKMGHSTGLMKMVQEEQVDFGVGCMAFAYDRHRYLKPGIAHYTSKVLFAVPAGRLFTAFEKLFCPFSVTIWMLTGLCLATGLTVTYVLQYRSRNTRFFVYGEGIPTPFLNMLNIFFGGALERTPRRNFARTLLLLWIIFCFVIRTLYQGSLYLYLQRTMSHAPLQTMADIDRSGIRYYMMEIGQRYFGTMPHVLERTTYIQPGKDSLGKTIENLGRGLIYGVVLIPLDHAAYHNKIFPKSEFVQIAKEHIAVYPVGFYYPKKSRLTKVFDEQIRNVQSTGLIDFWIRRYGDYEFFGKKVTSTEPRKLNVHHLAGGYQVFICCLVISCIVFLMELISKQSALLRKLFEIATES